jgi:hypothetical protein
MNKILILVTIIFIQCSGIILAQHELYIADFYNNKDAAITISFDDGSYGQYQYAFPTLKKYGYNATFGIVGDWTRDTSTIFSENGYLFYKRLSYKNIHEMWEDGNEIAWHSMKHVAYNSDLSWNTLNKQLKNDIEYIDEVFFPIEIYTIHYPYSKTRGKIQLAAKSAGFLFGRTGNDEYNEIKNINYYLLNSIAIYNNDSPNHDKFNKILDDAKGKWCIFMYHHIIPDTAKNKKLYETHQIEDNYAITPENFEDQIVSISKRDYWVSTNYNIGRYLQQKENSDIYVETENDNIFITILCDLDSEIYNQEMTIIYDGKLYNMKPNIRTKILNL